MPLDNKALLLDLVQWLADHPKPYDDVMAAWRTSCPRLQIWEDALDHGLVTRQQQGQLVAITDKGRAFLSGGVATS